MSDAPPESWQARVRHDIDEAFRDFLLPPDAFMVACELALNAARRHRRCCSSLDQHTSPSRENLTCVRLFSALGALLALGFLRRCRLTHEGEENVSHWWVRPGGIRRQREREWERDAAKYADCASPDTPSPTAPEGEPTDDSVEVNLGSPVDVDIAPEAAAEALAGDHR